jgi:TonB family protein
VVLVTLDLPEKIMRRILVASILLSPLFVTATAVASKPASDAIASTQVRPISTGVVPAKIVSLIDIKVPATTTIQDNAQVVLQLNIDQNGKAHDIEVIQSRNPELDAPVVAAVRGFRFRAATLDNQAIPVSMSLTVRVQH